MTTDLFSLAQIKLETLDWVIVVVSILICFIPALFYGKKSGESTSEFFASGQSVPWWLIGISMVATTFSTDTPNFVTNLIRKEGVASNWQWWAFALTGMSTVFFFARMWRRSGVLTDLEFYEIRYSGKPASFLRGFRALYLGLFFNIIIMGSVNLAATKISGILFGFEKEQTLLVCGIICMLFAATSGLWGVLVIDMIQFGIAMAGSFALAYFALSQPEVGGLAGMVEKVNKINPQTLNLIPDSGSTLFWSVFLIPLLIGWWSSWYPGAEPGGGSYIAQRMLAAKSERDALGGTLFFNLAHYVLRPWPWIIVGLCSMVVFPQLADIKTAFPNLDPKLLGDDIAYPAMMKLLPTGWLGIMIAGLLAAYVSTIITHLNWGSSYIVHDFYRRFIKNDASEKHYIFMGRFSTAMLMILSGVITIFLEDAEKNFKLILQIGAGTGALYLLRWFWWRINAWSEITAMVASLIVAITFAVLEKYHVQGFLMKNQLPIGIAFTTLSWVLVTFLTTPTESGVLQRFYDLVRPYAAGWRPFVANSKSHAASDDMAQAIIGWVTGVGTIWLGICMIGSFLYGRTGQSMILGAAFLLCAVILLRTIRKLWA